VSFMHPLLRDEPIGGQPPLGHIKCFCLSSVSLVQYVIPKGSLNYVSSATNLQSSDSFLALTLL
jgi:hypothetical protein